MPRIKLCNDDEIAARAEEGLIGRHQTRVVIDRMRLISGNVTDGRLPEDW